MILQYSLAVIQPHISSPQPGSVVLVLIGHKVVDESGDSGFEGVSTLVGAVPKQVNDTCNTTNIHRGEKECLHWMIFSFVQYSGQLLTLMITVCLQKNLSLQVNILQMSVKCILIINNPIVSV